MKRLTTLSALAIGLAWAGTSGAAEPRQAFGPGEQLQYDISYLGITAAEAQITVGAPAQQAGQAVWPIIATAETHPRLAFYAVKDKFVTYWDPALGRSLGHDFLAIENGKRRRQRVRVDHAGGKAQVTRQKEGERTDERSHDILAGAGDVAAASFRIRTLPLAVGKVFEVPVFTGSKSFILRATVEGKEKVKSHLGEGEAFRVRVQTEFSGKFESKRDIFAFITTDERRIPVRIDAEFVLGTVRAELSDYKEGMRLAVKVPPALSEGSGGY